MFAAMRLASSLVSSSPLRLILEIDAGEGRSEHTRSIWMDTEVSPQAPMLDQDLTVDAIIVGSGIGGLSTAYELALEGRKVAVLDRGPIAGGITARTTAHLTSLCDGSFKNLIDVQGLDAAKQFYQSGAVPICASTHARTAGNRQSAGNAWPVVSAKPRHSAWWRRRTANARL